MGVADVWSRALVYFGIVEEDEYWDEEAYAAEEDLERTYDRDRQNVRRLNPRARQRDEFEDWSEPDAQGSGRATVVRPSGGRRPLEAVASASVRVHLVVPRSFNDAQSIADKFKDAVPVIVNLQGRTPSCRSGSLTSRAASPTPSAGACSASRTRSSCSRPATSRSRQRSVRASSTAASSTSLSGRRPLTGRAAL